MTRSQPSNINLGVLSCNPLMVLGLAHYIADLRLGHRCLLATTSLIGLEDKLRKADVSVFVVELSGSSQEMVNIALRLRILHEQYPSLNIVVYTACDDAAILASLHSLARISLISQQESPEQMRKAMIKALEVGSVYSTSIIQGLNKVNESKLLDSRVLTRSERDVLTYLFAGLSLTEIARLCNRSIKTISAHKRSVIRKLGVRSDAELFQISQRDATLTKNLTENVSQSNPLW